MKAAISPCRFLMLVLVVMLAGQAWGQAVKYESQGKRDPFLDLRTTLERPQSPRVAAPPPLEKRPPGLAGLLIAEVKIIGTASGPDTDLAILQGVDKMSYFAREGTKLFDGYLESVSPDEAVFIQIQKDTAGTERRTKVVKRTQTEEQ